MPADEVARFLVIEGPPGSASPFVDRARAQGARIVDGFGPAGEPRSAIRFGTVDGPAAAAAALLAALDGSGLILEVRADPAVLDALVDDLRRLGSVDHRIATTDPRPVLPAEARAILGLLAEGHSLGEAAGILGLARRTADRRLAAARVALGVERTTEAVARARRLGWVGSGGRDA